MNKSRILLFGDRSWLSPEMERHLLDAGYQLISVSSAQTEHLTEESYQIKPDLVLLNYALSDLPKLKEALEQIRFHLQIPVIDVHTGLENLDQDRVEEATVGSYGTRWWDGESLVSVINEKIEAYRLQREPVSGPLRVEYRRGKRTPGFLCIRSSHRLTSVRFEDILYIEAMKDYVLIYTDSMVHTSHISMKEIVGLLPEEDFTRIHRSFIIRLDKITSIKYPELVVGKKIRSLPIGGYYRKNLYDKLLII